MRRADVEGAAAGSVTPDTGSAREPEARAGVVEVEAEREWQEEGEGEEVEAAEVGAVVELEREWECSDKLSEW